LFIPQKTAQCEMIGGASGAEQGVQLAQRLNAARLI
jgi:hypothetical protein